MNIWVKCMYVYGVWMCVRVFWNAQALHGETNALYQKFIKRQNSMHLTLLRHQNTKTSLYKLSKNHWVTTLLEILGSVRIKLQSTVSLDHPVSTFKSVTCLCLPSFNFRRRHTCLYIIIFFIQLACTEGKPAKLKG